MRSSFRVASLLLAALAAHACTSAIQGPGQPTDLPIGPSSPTETVLETPTATPRAPETKLPTTIPPSDDTNPWFDPVVESELAKNQDRAIAAGTVRLFAVPPDAIDQDSYVDLDKGHLGTEGADLQIELNAFIGPRILMRIMNGAIGGLVEQGVETELGLVTCEGASPIAYTDSFMIELDQYLCVRTDESHVAFLHVDDFNGRSNFIIVRLSYLTVE